MTIEEKRSYVDKNDILVVTTAGPLKVASVGKYLVPYATMQDVVRPTTSDPAHLPVVSIGGDHPYRQWFGTNGNNGLAASYFDNGIEPYLAICYDTNSDPSSGLGGTFSSYSDMMSPDEARVLERKGVEYINHLARHLHHCFLANSGIRIWYTGAAAAPTVRINTTTVDLVGNGGAENVNLSIASYPTLADLSSAINAISGGVWRCEVATELLGTEATAKLLKTVAARNVAATSDATRSNQRFAVSGGIYLRYTGQTFERVVASKGSDNILQIFGDGVRRLSIDTTSVSTDTLQELVTAINAAGIAGLTASLVDNGFSAQVSKFRETYVNGDELCTNMYRYDAVPVTAEGVLLDAGIGQPYVLRRLIKAVVERASAVGIDVKSLAQPGGYLFTETLRGYQHIQQEFRITDEYRNIPAPKALPCAMLNSFVPHVTTPDSADRLKAVFRALEKSGPWYVNLLMHKVLPDGTSRYTFQNPESYYDMTEAQWIDTVQDLGARNRAGTMQVLPPSKARAARAACKMPANLVFNPTFENSGEQMLGVTSAAQGAAGGILPGWEIAASSSNFADFSVVDESVVLTFNGTIASGFPALVAFLPLEPGKTYEVGAIFDASGMTAGSANIVLRPQLAQIGPGRKVSSNTFDQAPSRFAGSCGKIQYVFTVSGSSPFDQGKIISAKGPFDLTSSPSHIKIDCDGIGSTADIDIAGATPTATTAKEIAAAINDGIAASATYAAYPEYHSIASAKDNRVIITHPWQQSPVYGSFISIPSGTTNDKRSTVWGSTSIRGYGFPSTPINSAFFGYKLEIFINTGSAGTLRIMQPYCCELQR